MKTGVHRWRRLANTLFMLFLAVTTQRAVAVEPCCGGQEDADGSTAGRSAVDGGAAAPTAQLRRLEQRTMLRAGAERAADPEMSARRIQAAAAYASALAGEDDAKFTQLATAALQNAVAAEAGLGGFDTLNAAIGAEAAGPSSAFGATDSIWERPELQENFRKLMTRAAEPDAGLAPILGPPSRITRIVGYGAREAADGELADCVCVGRRVGGVDEYCCTGMLVGKNVVVTAGHCFFCSGAGADGTAVVFVGNDVSGSGQTYTGKIHRHPGYGQGGLNNDLAVIVLDENVSGVRPCPIADTAEIDQATFVRAAGFGNSDFDSTMGFGVKRLVDVPVASISCNGTNDPANLGCDEGLELVAGFVGLGPDSCNGDSGGPVYVLVGDDARDPEAWAVAGATSRATASATRPCGDGGIYVRLDKYLDFIKNVPGGEF